MRWVCLLAVLVVYFVCLPAESKPPLRGEVRVSGAVIEVVPPSPDLSRKYEVVRCLFEERRLVVRYGGEILVVHEGETLPESSIRVSSFSRDEAVLEIGGRAGGSGKQGDFILVARSGDGVVLRYISRLHDGKVQSGAAPPSVPPGQVRSPEKDRP